MKIIELSEIDSTNEYCKRADTGEDMTVTALRQTDGRGTKGRSFVSDGGGVYITVMRHYENFGCADAFKIMVNSCVAVCRTVERFGLRPVIRWANDVLVSGKKICGTLIENTFSGDKITRSIVGIGLNVNNTLPDELKNIATTMRESSGSPLDVKAVRDKLTQNLKDCYTVEEYKKYIDWFGSEVLLRTAAGDRSAIALDVDDRGMLVVDCGGKMEKISSAEVTLRLL